MTDSGNHRMNPAMWLGSLFLFAAILSNGLFFAKVSGQQALPWINLLLGALAGAFCITALLRSQREPELRHGKAAGWTLSILSVLLLAFSILGFSAARKLPSASAAPQVGQKAPDFTLQDTSGHPVTLAQLLSSPMPGFAEPPKAVLLIFYRGYW
jgi:hypothetical protein